VQFLELAALGLAAVVPHDPLDVGHFPAELARQRRRRGTHAKLLLELREAHPQPA